MVPGLVDGVFTGFNHHVGSLFTQAFLGSRGWGHDKASFSLNSSGVGGESTTSVQQIPHIAQR